MAANGSIESGSVRRGSGQNFELANWELAFRCDLSVDTPVSESQPGGKKTAKVGNRTYKYPGDYSIERLFAQLSSKPTFVVPMV